MKQYNVRCIKHTDMDDIMKLHLTRDDIDLPEGAEDRRQLFEWIAFNNPVSNGEPTYYVAEDSGRIIAYHGRMPTDFNVNGDRIRGYFVHDLYVDPEYREKGVGFWLTMALAKEIEEKSNSFICLYGMTPLNREMQKRRGYYETGANSYIKYLRPNKELKKILKNKLLVKVTSAIFKSTMTFVDNIIFRVYSHQLNVTNIDRFDSRFNELFERIKDRIKVSSFKDVNFLNWKYVDRPVKRDVIIAVEDEEKLRGFVVVCLSPYRKAYPLGIITDIMSDPEDKDSIAALYMAAIKYLKKQNVDAIICILSDDRFARVLQKFLFFKKNPRTVMLGNLEKCEISEEILKDSSNWHFTRGESDGFMLNSGRDKE